jgi:hypothetical protein
MSTKLQTSPLQDYQITNEFAFTYQDKVFPICEHVLGLYGHDFEAIWQRRLYPISVKITSDVSRDSVRVFVDFINTRSINSDDLSPSTLFDLLTLANSYKLTILQTFCGAFIQTNIKNLLIPAVDFIRSSSDDSVLIEDAIRDNLHTLLPDQAFVLRTLPLNSLNRIILFPTDAKTTTFTQIYEFVVEVYREQGPSASLLFHGLDLRQLSGVQLRTLTSLPGFATSFIADSLWDTTKTLLDDNTELRLRLTVIEKDLELLQSECVCRSEFTETNSQVSTQLENLKGELASLTASCAMKTDLESLTKEYVRHSEFAKINSRNTSMSAAISTITQQANSQFAKLIELNRQIGARIRTVAQQDDLLSLVRVCFARGGQAMEQALRIEGWSLQGVPGIPKRDIQEHRGNCMIDTRIKQHHGRPCYHPITE